MLAKKGDVVWSGIDRDFEKEMPYRIVLEHPGSKGTGCWCPKEAIPFLKMIGIHVYLSEHYSSGYGASGCFFYSGYEPISPHLLIQNEIASCLLQKENKELIN